jgi:ribosomal protein S20
MKKTSTAAAAGKKNAAKKAFSDMVTPIDQDWL